MKAQGPRLAFRILTILTRSVRLLVLHPFNLLLATLIFLVILAPTTPAAAQAGPAKGESNTRAQALAWFDSRESPAAMRELQARAAALAAAPSAAVVALRDSLGVQGMVAIDPLTGTPRAVARLDGFLTGPSKAAPAAIALAYARANAAVVGLDAAALANLKLARDYVSIDGTHHLYFLQTVNGVPVFGNGLRANLTADGRLINLLGAPVADLTANTTTPAISAARAVAIARAEVRAPSKPAPALTASDARQPTTFANGDQAALVLFQTVGGLRLAWQTLAGDYQHVIDATSGAVLYRKSIVNEATGNVQDNYPNAPVGGNLHLVDFTANGWLPSGATTLAGPNAHVYSDVNDDNAANAPEEITPTGGNWNYGISFFNNSANCSAGFPCTWEQTTASSWQTNRLHGGTNLFYLVNKFHDYLKAAPIGFTPSAGNFEGSDRLNAEDIDGANTASGLPDGSHQNNANMSTPPDGQSPRMQMYLWTSPFVEAMGSDDAGVVYHEYTHGLSNRLVVDALGNSTLGGIQAGAMGEAWSDWYATDLLVGEGNETDGPADGDVLVGKYVTGGSGIRTQGIDCPVGSTAAACPGRPAAGSGGYTYGDFGKIRPGVEVHSDGEIWGETLWDLRKALGTGPAGLALTRNLVTRAMELSPANPSFLDMRNAILQADLVASNGAHRTAIWNVFKTRGMGYFAAALSGDDTGPVEDFSSPPAPNSPTAKLKGYVTNVDTGQVLPGATVAFGGHNSGFPGDLAGTTNQVGKYEIKKIFLGTYPKVFAAKPGWDTVVLPTLTIGPGENVHNFALRRDWASLFGGGQITFADPPDYTAFGCGPSGAIDQSLGTGWGSNAEWNGSGFNPKRIIIKLPQTINIVEFAVDPSNTCGDAGSASTKDYSIETSPDGTTWTVANSGTFGPANRGHLNSLPLLPNTGANVRYVRFSMLSPQLPAPFPDICPGPFSGCDFMDMSEIEVYGSP